MYVIIVGGGKVGWNLARELIDKEHEVTLIESDRRRYLVDRRRARARRAIRGTPRSCGFSSARECSVLTWLLR